MNNLNLDTVDLSTTLRRVPRNGSPSSQDYNDMMEEILTDLAALSDRINEGILPVLNALPEGAAAGLDGTTLLADPDATAPSIFINTETSEPLTVAEVLSRINSSLQAVQSAMAEVNAKVLALQSRLATTSQNDVARVIQGFSNSLETLDQMMLRLNSEASANTAQLAKIRYTRLATEDIASGETAEITLTWNPPFDSDDYSATVSLEDESGELSIVSWAKEDPGESITVTVLNSSADTAYAGTVHASAKED